MFLQSLFRPCEYKDAVEETHGESDSEQIQEQEPEQVNDP